MTLACCQILGPGLIVGLGSNSEVESHSRRVRSTPMNGHRQTGPTGPKSARGHWRLNRPPHQHGQAAGR